VHKKGVSHSHNESVFGYAPNSRFAKVLAGDLVQEGAIPILKGKGGCGFHFQKGGSEKSERCEVFYSGKLHRTLKHNPSAFVTIVVGNSERCFIWWCHSFTSLKTWSKETCRRRLYGWRGSECLHKDHFAQGSPKQRLRIHTRVVTMLA